MFSLQFWWLLINFILPLVMNCSWNSRRWYPVNLNIKRNIAVGATLLITHYLSWFTHISIVLLVRFTFGKCSLMFYMYYIYYSILIYMCCNPCSKKVGLFFFSVDHSRVKLTLKTPPQDSDYINANFIKVCGTSLTVFYYF